MGKRIFLLIIVLMSVALIGIISVQVFWIKNTIQITEEQFTSNVRFALAKVSEDIKQREFEDFYLEIRDLSRQGEKLNYSDVRRYIYEKIDTAKTERFAYSQSIIEQNYKVPTEFFENDTIDFKEIFSKEEIVIVKDQQFDNNFDRMKPPEETFVKIGRFEGAEKSELVRVLICIPVDYQFIKELVIRKLL